MILSVSRRCDIPSHYGAWFLQRLKEGYVLIQHPYHANRLSRVILSPDTIDMIVFWTKNPIPFLQYLPEIDAFGYPYYVTFTLTPYGKELERNLPDKELLIDAFERLSAGLGAHRVVWRYDPIILSERYDIAYHEAQFSAMAKRLQGSTKRCVISFVDGYAHVSARMGRDLSATLSQSSVYDLGRRFARIAEEHGLDLVTCAEQYDLAELGIRHGACLDPALMAPLVQGRIIAQKDKNQRAECLCLESIDIGTYNCCGNGCVYCYALQSDHSALAAIKKHKPDSPMLIGEPSPTAHITDRATRRVVSDQQSLFD